MSGRIKGDPKTWSQDDRDWYAMVLRVAKEKDEEIGKLRAHIAELDKQIEDLEELLKWRRDE